MRFDWVIAHDEILVALAELLEITPGWQAGIFLRVQRLGARTRFQISSWVRNVRGNDMIDVDQCSAKMFSPPQRSAAVR